MTKSLGFLTFIAASAFVAQSMPAHARDTISCESREYRYQHCSADTAGFARLVNQTSQAPCVQGRTWGFDRGGVWVNNGCAGEFEVGGGGRERSSYAPTPERGRGGSAAWERGDSVPGWATGTFHGTDASGHQQTITIDRDGAVTLRDRGGAVERGTYSGEMANLPSGQLGINPSGSNGILVNGMYFAR